MDSTLAFRLATALRCLAGSGPAGPGPARPGPARPDPVPWLLIVTTLVVMPVVNPAFAQSDSFNLDEITLPTDLIASVVRTEDDIRVANLLLANGGSEGGSVYGDLETQTSESPSSSGSIFDNPDSSTVDIVTTETIEPASAANTPGGAVAEDQVSVAEQSAIATGSSTEIAALPRVTTTSDPVIPAPQPEIAKVEEPKSQVTPNQEPDDDSPATTQGAAGQETEIAVIAPPGEQQDAEINEDEIILGWATAWSNNDVESYLDYYSESFTPANGQDRDAWEAKRRKRLKNQDIRIIVSNAEVYSIDGDFAEVRFTQRYTSKSYKDRVIKAITMRNTPDGWKFLSEKALEKLPFK